MNIGRSIRIAQEIRGVSNVAIASNFKVHCQQVSRWRNSKDMKISLVSSLSKYFNMSLDEFLGLSND